jgi:hypothetical protein
MACFPRCRGQEPRPVFARCAIRGRTRTVRGVVTVLLACAAHAGPMSVGARTLTVPDDAPSIQAAIDASTVDTILVRPGSYSETPVIRRPLLLKGLVDQGVSAEALPAIDGLVFDDLTVVESNTMSMTIQDLRFTSALEVTFDAGLYFDPLVIRFARCTLDAGMNDDRQTVLGQLEYELRGCTVDGPIRLARLDRIAMDSCVVRQPLSFGPSFAGISFVTLTRSLVTGSGPVGVDLAGYIQSTTLTGDTFQGYDIAVRDERSSSLEVSRNTFVGPGSRAVQSGSWGVTYFDGNRIKSYDVGIELLGEQAAHYAEHNRIEGCVTAGMDLHGDYIYCEQDTILSCGAGMILTARSDVTAEGNVVRSCVGDGISIQGRLADVESNVVGRCGGAGIGTSTDFFYRTQLRLRNNTSYSNDGSGYVVALEGGGPPSEIAGNIGYGNGRHGLEVLTSDPLVLACNDWFDNASGAVVGVAPSPADLAVNPAFCDVANDDVALAAHSPLLGLACGAVGSLGEGCSAQLAGRDQPSTRFGLACTGPNPGLGPARLEFWLPEPAEIALEVFDVQGRRVAVLARGAWPGGRHRVAWSGAERGAAGVFLVRLRYSGGHAELRIIVLR